MKINLFMVRQKKNYNNLKPYVEYFLISGPPLEMFIFMFILPSDFHLNN